MDAWSREQERGKKPQEPGSLTRFARIDGLIPGKTSRLLSMEMEESLMDYVAYGKNYLEGS